MIPKMGAATENINVTAVFIASKTSLKINILVINWEHRHYSQYASYFCIKFFSILKYIFHYFLSLSGASEALMRPLSRFFVTLLVINY